MVIELRTMEYEERLEVHGLTMKKIHKLGDLIQIYKIFKGIEKADIDAVYDS